MNTDKAIAALVKLAENQLDTRAAQFELLKLDHAKKCHKPGCHCSELLDSEGAAIERDRALLAEALASEA
jgi:hypothetical protein